MRRSIIARALVTAAAVCTAGLTGAGLAQAATGHDYFDSGWTESTAIEHHGLAGNGWRVLDSDRIKDHLIGDGLDHGVYDDLLATVLPDGRPLRPRELATLVHRESTQVLDMVQQRCIEAGENIVIEGTFRWGRPRRPAAHRPRRPVHPYVGHQPLPGRVGAVDLRTQRPGGVRSSTVSGDRVDDVVRRRLHHRHARRVHDHQTPRRHQLRLGTEQ